MWYQTYLLAKVFVTTDVLTRFVYWDAATGSLNYYQGTTRVDLMASDSSSQKSLSQAGPQGLWPSVSNFVIPIASSNGAGTAAIMYFLDSGGGSYPEVISASQVSWFEEVSSQHNPTARSPLFLC
jgi:hypothetical protein